MHGVDLSTFYNTSILRLMCVSSFSAASRNAAEMLEAMCLADRLMYNHLCGAFAS